MAVWRDVGSGQGWLDCARVLLCKQWLKLIRWRCPTHEPKRSFRVWTPGNDPLCRERLRNIASVFPGRRSEVELLRARGCETCQAVSGGENDIPGTALAGGMTSIPVIAAIGFHSTAVRIDRINFRPIFGSKRVAGLEQDAAVMKNIGGESVRWTIGQGERLAAFQVLGFDYESSADSTRIDNAILWEIEGSNARFGRRGNAPRVSSG